ncbi:hypothetical protein C8R44DRAFT_546360, partial [Mycena epipterygia]
DDGGVQTDPIDDDYDTFFGDGSDLAAVDLPGDAVLPPNEEELLKRFNEALDAIKLMTCGCCREEGFHVKPKASGNCARCHSDQGDVKRWSDENNVNPSTDRPACLKNLTDMEEMLIARVKPVMQVRWTRG